MIKYLWIVILIAVNVIAIAFIIYGLKSAWDYCVSHNETTLGDFFSEIDPDVYAVTIILTVAWFIVSIIAFVISEYGG